MPTKIFSHSVRPNGIEGGDNRLVIETGNTHFACLICDDQHNITALEWFKHDRSEQAGFEELFKKIKETSEIINREVRSVDVYINNGSSVLIPKALFDVQSAEDYLDTVAGEAVKSTSLFDPVYVSEDLVNGYRVPTHVLNVLKENLPLSRFQHTISKTISRLSANHNPPVCLFVQFYDSEIIVIVMDEGRLQFMQLFTYTLADDVLYYLLSLAQRLKLNHDKLVVKVSGMVDTNATLYHQLLRYFKNVSPEAVTKERVLFNTGEHPMHYFTPIINLAL